jgi:hypothetical protein
VSQEQGIRAFWAINKIGRPMMYEDPFDLEYGNLMQAINDDNCIQKRIASL